MTLIPVLGFRRSYMVGFISKKVRKREVPIGTGGFYVFNMVCALTPPPMSTVTANTWDWIRFDVGSSYQQKSTLIYSLMACLANSSNPPCSQFQVKYRISRLNVLPAQVLITVNVFVNLKLDLLGFP